MFELLATPTGLLALSAAVLVGMLVLGSVRGAARATVVVSRTQRVVTLDRRRVETTVLVPQTDPDAAGRPRPRAPSGRTCG